MKILGPERRGRAGFTLLEIAIALAILGAVIGGMSAVLESSRKGFAQGMAQAAVQADARRALDRIAQELENAGLATLVPNPAGVASSDLVFQIATGANGANNTITFGPSTRLSFAYEAAEANNGLDDDGDGLIDEGRVILTRNYLQAGEKSITLVKGVSEYLRGETANGLDDNGNGFADEQGFCMTMQGNLLILRLTLLRRLTERQSVTATVQTSVRFKN